MGHYGRHGQERACDKGVHDIIARKLDGNYIWRNRSESSFSLAYLIWQSAQASINIIV